MATATDIQARPSAVCPDNGCSACVAMCEKKPCWPTAQDAQRLIDAGYGHKLMIDQFVTGPRETYVLSPATVAYEHGDTQRFGQCVFLTQDGKCQLHDVGLKPTEGRLADCQDETANADLQRLVADTWMTSEGRNMILQFEDAHGVQRKDVPRDHVVVMMKDGSSHTFNTGRWHREWEPSDEQPMINVLVILSEVDPPPDQEREKLAVFTDWAGVRTESW